MPEIFRGATQDSCGAPMRRGAWIARHCLIWVKQKILLKVSQILMLELILIFVTLI